MAEVDAELRAIFCKALELRSADEVRQFLDDACRDNINLRQDVMGLLKSHREAGNFLGGLPTTESTIETPIAERPGTQIGPYKLLQQIGEGGMGVVFMAEQERPIQRTVALKIIKAGMDTRQVIARFEAERQALAMMDHPNIARVIDAGTTEAGRPYFVMDLVKGVPITEYCDQQQLSVRERLELMGQVCHAVQHAHQKGIIHRDIKPTNVLVAEYDGKPVPKIIDFGVAKATAQRLTERTMFTQYGQIVGTFEYMSPEQARFNQLDIDTRSDIYSLGVLLYELLVGTTPFDRQRFETAPFDETLRIIREEEPPRPSTRLHSSDTLPAIAANRHTEPSRLRKEICGDLDWIVMKCLEKDRTRRYESASELVQDIERCLNDEPVAASPPSTGYRLRKFVQRNKTPVMTAAMLLIALVGGVIGTTWQAVRATEERNQKEQARQDAVASEKKAEAAAAEAREQEAAANRERERAERNYQLARHAVDRMFTRVAEDLRDAPHMAQIRRELLEDALEFYQQFLEEKGNDVSVRHEAALAHFRVGAIYNYLGQYDKSLAPLEKSLALLEQLHEQDRAEPKYREEMIEVYGTRSDSLLWIQGAAASIEPVRQALAIQSELYRDYPRQQRYLRRTAHFQAQLAVKMEDSGLVQESLEHFRQAIALYEKDRVEFPGTPEDRGLLAHIHHWYGDALMSAGRLQEAEQSLRLSHELRKQFLAENPLNRGLRFNLAHIKEYLAQVLGRIGKTVEAEQLVSEAVKLDEQLLDDFPANANYLRRAGTDYEAWGKLLFALGRNDEASAAFRRSLKIREDRAVRNSSISEHLNEVAWSYYHFGVLLESTNDPPSAAVAFRRAFAELEKLVAEHPQVPRFQNHLGWMLATCPALQFRDPQRAVELAKQALQGEPTAARHWGLLGVAQYGAGDYEAALATLTKLLAMPGGDNAETWLGLAMANERLEHHQEARKWYDKANAWIEKYRPADEEYYRFRAEAAKLLGLENQPESPPRSPANESDHRDHPQPNVETNESIESASTDQHDL